VRRVEFPRANHGGKQSAEIEKGAAAEKLQLDSPKVAQW
jgi:hypothetical protein